MIESVEELSEVVRSSSAINVVCGRSKEKFRLTTAEQRVEPTVIGMKGIVDFSPNDQVVVVCAGTPLVELLPELAESGQTIPFPVRKEFTPHVSGFPGSVGGTISMNLPHGLEAQCGSWRDWILGMTIVLADGTIAKSGSKAVKNVAGYDAHKLFVGARGTLGVIAEVVLKTFPIDALPQHAVETLAEWNEGPEWIQRTLPSEFEDAVKNARGKLLAVDWASSTLWSEMEPQTTGIKYTGDWFIRSGYDGGDLYRPDDATTALMLRAKKIFDPDSKLNPGELDTH